MRIFAVALFFGGLLLAVRVMLFGVRRRLSDDQVDHRKWPLALAAFLAVVGAMLYAAGNAPVTIGRAMATLIAGVVAGGGAWLLVKRSAAIPSTDPEDDPRYRFQGHIARVVAPIRASDQVGGHDGRIIMEFDGKRYEFGARWAPDADHGPGAGQSAEVDAEVVIEYVDGDIAYVEPWAVVEERL